MQWRSGTVLAQVRQWAGAVEYSVSVADLGQVRALAYLALSGPAEPGDRVLLNCSALTKGLGTGGLALIVAIPDRMPPDSPTDGHIVKARYTPQQQMFLAVDEQDSPHHAVLTSQAARDGDLGGMPVVVADLHSALPAILAGIRMERPTARVAYIMTDGAALPIAFSRSVAGLLEAGWLTTTVTVGQAFGGLHEAVNLHSGLLAARLALDIDIAVVSQGPGNVGTGTPWGFSGLAAGEALTTAWLLHGRAVGSVRVSGSDPRWRHRGLSHHTRTAFGRVALGEFDLVVLRPDSAFRAQVLDSAHELVGAASGRPRLRIATSDGLREALADCPVRLSTMGRDMSVDPEPFLYAAAAGRHAASLA